KKAFTALAQQVVARAQEGLEDVIPVVELEADSYSHSKYGKIHTPVFKVVGWQMVDGAEAEAKPEEAAEEAHAPAANEKLVVRDLTHTYLTANNEKVPAIKDVNFTVVDKPGKGEVVVFLGPSGCAKSSILKCVAGLVNPTKGTIFSKGKPVEGTSRDRGMVFQQYTSFAWLTVLKNVEYGLRLNGVPRRDRERMARRVLEQVGLKGFENKYPKELSGGMKQRVAIARTLVNGPDLVLMDEPFGALDPQTRWGMQSLLLDISDEADNTILFVTHDVAEAVYLADTIYILSHRPATILTKKTLPHWGERDLA
ncbi:MAG: ABC transporter ATP-binding protein, partial [Sandaracinaceae bacterium]